MLLLRSRWQFAANRLLTGEARLLAFAGEAQNEEGGGPQLPTEGGAAENTGKKPEGVTKAQEATHGKVEEALAHGPQGEHGEAHKPKSAIEEFYEATEKTDKDIEELLHTMEHGLPRESAKLRGAEALRDWDDSIDILKHGKELYGGYKTVMADLQKWEGGNLSPAAFAENMRTLYSGREEGPGIMRDVDQYMIDHADEIREYGTLHEPEETAKKIEQWEQGSLPPTDFASAAVAFFEGQEEERRIQEFLATHAAELGAWNTLNESTKVQLREALNQIANPEEMKRRIEKNREIRRVLSEQAHLDELLRTLDEQMGKWRGLLAEVKKRAEARMAELEKEGQRPTAEGAHWGGFRNIFSGLGVKLYSPLEVWEAFKMVKEAYIDAFHTHTHHEAAVVAKQIGGVARHLPYGDDVNVALRQKLESANEKEKNDYKKEYLEPNHFTFKQLFTDANAVIKENEHNPNKVRAVLEYAASRGWLYDLDNSVDQSEKRTLGLSINHLLHDYDQHELNNFYLLLRGMNASGREKETKDTYDRIQAIENIPFFINEINRELDDANLWGAVGVAKRAIERGLTAEVSPWITTTVMRHLRTNPLVRQYAKKEFLDKIGTLAAYRSALTLGHLKIERAAMEKILQRDGDLRETDIGNVIGLLEEDIKQKAQRELSPLELDRYVARVLGAQTIELPGGKVSIFSERYGTYRADRFIKTQGDLSEPGLAKEDTDYWTQITDNILMGERPYEQLLEGNGRGGFTNGEFVQQYIGNLLGVYRDLQAQGLTNEAESFRLEAGKKFTVAVSKGVLSDERTKTVHEFKTKGAAPGEFAMSTMIKEGFLDVRVLLRGIQNKAAGAYWIQQALKQINADLSGRLENALENAPQNPAQFEQYIREWVTFVGKRMPT